jgi:hypothetical protein
MHGFVEALGKRDVEKALSFCAEDAIWVTPEGTFKGREELGRYLTWSSQTISAIRETGIKAVVQGDRGACEHVLAGTSEGVKWEVLALCVCEFSSDKIQSLRMFYDRLSVAKQVAEGGLAEMLVNSIVKRMEEGLH